MVRYRRILALVMMLIMVFSLSPTVGMTSESVLEENRFNFLETRLSQLYDEVINTLDQEKIDELNTEAMKILREIAQKQVLESLKEATIEAHSIDRIDDFETQSIPPVTHIQLGHITTFAFASEGKRGSWVDGIGSVTTTFDLPNNRNNVGMWTSPGYATGWAWTGRRFFVNGQGTQTASFDIDGMYKALYNTVGQSSVSSGYATFNLYNATTQQWIIQDHTIGGGTYIFGNNGLEGETFSRNNFVSAPLTAGNEYVVLFMFEGYVLFSAYLESGTDNYHSKWTTIRINF